METEEKIAVVTLTLRDSANVVVATTTTTADGSFSFVNIPAGRYSVEETQPAGYGSSTPDTVVLDVQAGGAAPIVNFGDTAGSLTALVYNDSNSDGVPHCRRTADRQSDTPSFRHGCAR